MIRVFLGITFATYGLVKVLGGQYNYGDWVIDRKTVSGTSLVWAFYGYSPFYGRFTGLFELVPAMLLLIPRTATIGAAALFAVALNVTAMDFGFDYPAVKYFALAYTVLLGVLLWVDRQKLSLLLLDREQAHMVAASAPNLPQAPIGPLFSPLARRLLRSRQTGLIGLDWTATVDYAVIGPQSTDTVTVHARKITAVLPWRVTGVTGTRR